MLQSLCDSSPEVRQAAAYGVGVMAQYGGENYRPFCTGSLVLQLLHYWQHIAFSWQLHDVFVSLFLFQRPFPCWSESSRQPTRAPRRTSMPQKTASLLLERSRGSGQSVSMSMRSFPTGSAGSHSTRTKRRPSTRLTSCVTSLKGRTATMSFSPLIAELVMHQKSLETSFVLDNYHLSTATTPLSLDQTTPTFLKFSSSSQTELQMNLSRVRMLAANGSQTSYVKYRYYLAFHYLRKL